MLRLFRYIFELDLQFDLWLNKFSKMLTFECRFDLTLGTKIKSQEVMSTISQQCCVSNSGRTNKATNVEVKILLAHCTTKR